MLSSNLYKAGWVVMSEDARVIDTNELVKTKLGDASIGGGFLDGFDYGGDDGFYEGLDAGAVDALLNPDGAGAVIKNPAQEQQEELNQQLEAARAELETLRAQADQMLDLANAQIEEMRRKALEEAQMQGYQEGYERGMAEVQGMKDELQNKEAMLQEQYSQLVENLEPDFIETLSEIYGHIFKVDLSSYSQIVVNLLTNTLQKMDSASNYIVHVSKKDYQQVLAAKDSIIEETGVVSGSLEIVSDVTLSQSQCMIETEGGVYDCSLGTELEELERKLKLLSYSKQV